MYILNNVYYIEYDISWFGLLMLYLAFCWCPFLPPLAQNDLKGTEQKRTKADKKGHESIKNSKKSTKREGRGRKGA